MNEATECSDSDWLLELLNLVDRVEEGDKGACSQIRASVQKKLTKEDTKNESKYEDNSFYLKTLAQRNDSLEEEVSRLRQELKSLEPVPIEGFPKSEEDIRSLMKTLKDAEGILKQRCVDAKKSDAANAELNIRLVLEQERRVRAQNVIGDIEKERITLKNLLESKNSDYQNKVQEFDEIKMSCDFKITKMLGEVKKLEMKLEKSTNEKDQKIQELKKINKELVKKIDAYEQRYENQLDVSKTLQNELQASYGETQSLIKEMEMLNLMFAELENHIINQEKYTMSGANEPDKQMNATDVLSAAQSAGPSNTLLQESCFNEVTTKYGTKMVLSVSKTFLKLKDLILEKNTLEDQMTKMKNINEHLCSQLNVHEEKLCGITDELNSTWFYVSKIKEQHKKLHSSEQILRAELAEKRQLLKSIRKELEESRTAWNVVKQKTAESEAQWIQLKVDFAERKRVLQMSSSESGVSDLGADNTEADNTDADEKASDNDTESLPEKDEVLNLVEVNDLIPLLENDDEDDISDSMSIPDPFSDEEDNGLDMNSLYPMINSTTSLVNEDEDDEEVEEDESDTESLGEPVQQDERFTPIFVPSISYLAHVPSSMQPRLLGSGKGDLDMEDKPARERIDNDALEDVDDNVRDLMNRLSSSTARGAFLANRLADIHKRIATGSSLADRNEWLDEAEETETDIDPKETEYEDDLTVPSPELDSDVGDSLLNDEDELNLPVTSTPNCDFDSFEDSRPASADSMILAIDEAINILDPVHSQGLTMLAQPQSSFPLLGPQTDLTMRPAPTLDQHFEEDEESDPIDSEQIKTEVPEDIQNDGSTAVTRFLIKHLPKQLTQLRNEKHELEDKIHDLEQVVSEQRMQMAEHERRVELERTKLKKLEERLNEIDVEKQNNGKKNVSITEEKQDEKESVPITFRVPVEVDQQDVRLSWTIECRNERACSYWVNYIPPGGDESDAVILPNTVRTVEPLEVGLVTCLTVECGHKGRYTLHIEGSGNRMPQVAVNLSPVTSE